MSDTKAARFQRVNRAFLTCMDAVPADAWDNPTPCDGWVARDVVEHLVEWVPSFLAGGGIEFGPLAGDPVASWKSASATIQRALDDPATATRTFEAGPLGEMSIENAVDMTITGDVLVHTWDLATATGQEVRLDPAVVHDQVAGMSSMGDALEQSGHFGPRVSVPDDADEQTKLLALSGRNPATSPT